eukprot:1677456-Amphidinium_carterae.1
MYAIIYVGTVTPRFVDGHDRFATPDGLKGASPQHIWQLDSKSNRASFQTDSKHKRLPSLSRGKKKGKKRFTVNQGLPDQRPESQKHQKRTNGTRNWSSTENRKHHSWATLYPAKTVPQVATQQAVSVRQASNSGRSDGKSILVLVLRATSTVQDVVLIFHQCFVLGSGCNAAEEQRCQGRTHAIQKCGEAAAAHAVINMDGMVLLLMRNHATPRLHLEPIKPLVVPLKLIGLTPDATAQPRNPQPYQDTKIGTNEGSTLSGWDM